MIKHLFLLLALCSVSFLSNAQQTQIMQVNGKWALVSGSYPNFIGTGRYDEIIGKCKDNLLIVRSGNKIGVIDTTGKELLPLEYDMIAFNYPAITLKAIKGGKYGLFDRKLKVLVPFEYESASDLYDEKTRTLYYNFTKMNYSFLVDTTGKRIYAGTRAFAISGSDLLVSKFTGDTLTYTDNYYYNYMPSLNGMVSLSGKWKIPLFNGSLNFMANDLVYFENKEDNWNGVYDREGKVRVKGSFTSISPLYNYDQFYRTIPTDTIVFDDRFSDTLIYMNWACTKVHGKVFMRDDGPFYNSATDKYGYVRRGKVLIKPEYDEYFSADKNTIFAHKGQTTFVFDTLGNLKKTVPNSFLKHFYDYYNRALNVYYSYADDVTMLYNSSFKPVKAFDAMRTEPIVCNDGTVFVGVVQKGREFYITSTGAEAFPGVRNYSIDLKGDFVVLEEESGKKSLYTTKLKLVKPDCGFVEYLDTDVYVFTRGDVVTYFKGKQLIRIIPDGYTVYQMYASGTKLFYTIVSKDSAMGVVDSLGKVIIPATFDFIDVFYDEKGVTPTYFLVTKNQLQGLLDLDGETVLAPIHNGLSWNPVGVAQINAPEGSYMIRPDFSHVNEKPFIAKKDLGFLSVVTYADKKMQLTDNACKPVSGEYNRILYDDYAYFQFKVERDGKWGVIDSSGKEIVLCEWDSVSLGGLVYRGGKAYVTDFATGVRQDVPLDSVYFEGVNYLGKKDGKWGFAPFNSNSFVFDRIIGRYDYATCSFNGKWGMWNYATNNWSIQPKYDAPVIIFADSLYEARKGKKLILIDKKQKVVYETAADWIFYPFSADGRMNSSFLVNSGGKMDMDNIYERIGGKYGLTDRKGKVLHKLNADHIIEIEYKANTEYPADYERRELLGYVWHVGGTKSRYVATEVDYESFDEYGNPLMIKAMLTNQRYRGGKFGFVNIEGKEVIPAKFDEIALKLNYNDKNSGYYYSYQIAQTKRVSLSDSVNVEWTGIAGMEPVFVRSGNKWGAYDFTGKMILPVEYDSLIDVDYFTSSKYIKAWKDGKFGYFRQNGQVVIDVQCTGERQLICTNERPYYIIQQNGKVIPYEFVVRKAVQYFNIEVWTDSLDADGKPIMRDYKIKEQEFVGGTFGVIDMETGKWLIDCNYEDLDFAGIAYTPSASYEYHEKRVSRKATGRVNNESELILTFKSPFLYKKNNKWGSAYLYRTGGVIPNYDSIHVNFTDYDSLYYVYAGSKMGICDVNGKELVPPKFDNAFTVWVSDMVDVEGSDMLLLQEGGTKTDYTRTYPGGPYTRIDYWTGMMIDSVNANGELVYSTQVSDQRYFTNAKFGIYAPRKQRWKIEPGATDMIFMSNLQEYERTGKWAYTSLNAPTLLAINQGRISMDKPHIIHRNADIWYYNGTDSVGTKLDYDKIEPRYTNDYNGYFLTTKGGKQGMLTFDLKESIPPVYDHVHAFSGPVVLVNNGGHTDKISMKQMQKSKYTVLSGLNEFIERDSVDAKGNPVIRPVTHEWNWISGGNFSLYSPWQKKELVAPTSALMYIPCIENYSDGTVFKTISNPLVFSPWIEAIDTTSAVFIQEGNKLKAINLTTLQVVGEWEKEHYLPRTRSFAVLKNGKWGVVGADGHMVLECEYDKIEEVNGLWYAVTKDGVTKYATPFGKVLNSMDNSRFGKMYYNMYRFSLDDGGSSVYSIITGNIVDGGWEGIYIEMEDMQK